MLGANDVNVCWPVVVRVDDSSKVANSQDGRHMRRIHIPKRLGYFDYFSNQDSFTRGEGERFARARMPTHAMNGAPSMSVVYVWATRRAPSVWVIHVWATRRRSIIIRVNWVP